MISLRGVGVPAGSAVGDDRGFLPFEGNAAEPCDQGLPVGLADADGLEALSCRGQDRGTG